MNNSERKDKEKATKIIWERERVHLVCLQLRFRARKNVLVWLWNGFICWLVTLWTIKKKKNKIKKKVLEENVSVLTILAIPLL